MVYLIYANLQWAEWAFSNYLGMIDPKTHSMNNVYIALIGIILSFILGFIATMLFWKDDTSKNQVVSNQDVTTKDTLQELIESPLEGKVLPLSEVKDEVFF